MKKANENIVRQKYSEILLDFFKQQDEDVDRIKSNVINFPIVENEEEGWVEITVKVVKDDEGYEKRQEYLIALEKSKQAKIKAEKLKQEKIEKDNQRRLAKQLKREKGD